MALSFQKRVRKGNMKAQRKFSEAKLLPPWSRRTINWGIKQLRKLPKQQMHMCRSLGFYFSALHSWLILGNPPLTANLNSTKVLLTTTTLSTTFCTGVFRFSTVVLLPPRSSTITYTSIQKGIIYPMYDSWCWRWWGSTTIVLCFSPFVVLLYVLRDFM